MSDEELSPCECMLYQELIIKRLLSILRQTQGYCADNECFGEDNLPGPSSQPSDNYFIAFLMIAFVALMYAFRPNSLRQTNNDEIKFSGNDTDPDNDPPAAPPAVG